MAKSQGGMEKLEPPNSEEVKCFLWDGKATILIPILK